MEILDLKKEFKPLYNASSKTPQLVDVPCLSFLRIDGAIEPGLAPGSSPLFQENMRALYGAAYTLKFMLKQRPVDPIDYPVMAFEGLWWVEDGHFDINIKDNWFYTLQIMQPGLLTPDLLAEALLKLRKKKGDLESFSRLRLEMFQEGPSVQMLHIGPYATEPVTVDKIESYAQAQGLQIAGKHHEIYLGNPLLANPEKLKTILRHAVTKSNNN